MGNCLGLSDFIGSPNHLKGLHRIRTFLPRTTEKQPATRRHRNKKQSIRRSSISVEQINVLDQPTEDLKLHYDLGEEIGRGQFGVIRLCKSTQTGKQFACKSIAKDRLFRQKDLDAVRREIQIMKHLNGHPQIVELEAVYEDKTWVHLVLELCEGGELFDNIVKEKVYSEKDAAETCKSLMEAVEYCHSHGVIHRDLKPENILLVNQKCPSQVKVADFGLAVNFQPGDKFSGTAGSAYYIAPEILRGEHSEEVDVWSVGVILYILLCGVPPFWDSTEEGVLDAIRDGDLDLLSDPWPRVSAAAKDLIRGMLCPDIKKRLSPERVLNHEWIIKHTETSNLDQSLINLQRDSNQSHTYSDVSLFTYDSIISEDSCFASSTSLASSFPESFWSMAGEMQTSAISSRNTSTNSVLAGLYPASESSFLKTDTEKDSSQFGTSTSFTTLVEQIVHKLSTICISKADNDTHLISETISHLQPNNHLTCTLLEATSLKETVIVNLCKEQFFVVLDKEKEKIGWKHVEEDKVKSALETRGMRWLPCSAFQTQPQLVC